MVTTFGDNISGAFTGGQPVKAIYSKGEKVWPVRDIQTGYTRYDYIHSFMDSSTTPAAFKISGIPWGTNSSIEVKVDLQAFSQTFTGNWILAYSGGSVGWHPDVAKDIFKVYGDRYSTDKQIKVAHYENYDAESGTSVVETYVPASDMVILKVTPTALYADGVLVANWPIVTGYSSIILSIFGYWNYQQDAWDFSSSTGSNEHIYWVKVKSGNALLYKFVPAVRDSDGKKGLWEEVNEQFYIRDSTTYGALYVGNDN